MTRTSAAPPPDDLYRRLVDATGLHASVAPFTVRRVLLRIGVFEPGARLTRADIESALPHFAEVLRAFYPDPAEYAGAMARLARVAGPEPAGR